MKSCYLFAFKRDHGDKGNHSFTGVIGDILDLGKHFGCDGHFLTVLIAVGMTSRRL
jgi:hypothetical protein